MQKIYIDMYVHKTYVYIVYRARFTIQQPCMRSRRKTTLNQNYVRPRYTRWLRRVLPPGESR